MEILNHIKKQEGFTFSEALIVFAIVLLILGTLAHSSYSFFETLEEQHFIHMLERDLLFGHTYAVTNHQFVWFTYSFEENIYLLSVNQKLLIKRDLPDHIYFLQGQKMNYFYFSPTGNISRFGTLTFYINGKPYQVIFTIGKGRFRIVQGT